MTFLFISMGIIGCDTGRYSSSAPPAPGTFQVISIERVEPEPIEIIANSSFREWYAGLDFPTGFSAPSDPKISVVRRESASRYPEAQGYAAHQEWLEQDYTQHPDLRWGTTVVLEPDTSYEFSVVVEASKADSVVVQVCEYGSSGLPHFLDLELVRIDKGSPEEIRGKFTTVKGGSVRLSSCVLPSSKFPVSATWYEWSLKTSGNAPEDISVPNDDSIQQLAKNTVAQISAQADLYGGISTWRTNVEPTFRKFDEMLIRAKKEAKELLVSPAGFVFGQNDLRLLRNAESLVTQDWRVKNVQYRPLFNDLIRFNQTLNAMGIDFVCVPIPSRATLGMDFIVPQGPDSPPAYAAYWELIEGLAGQGIATVNVLPNLKDLQSQGKAAYARTSTELLGPGHAAIGRVVADSIAPMTYHLRTTVDTYSSDVRRIPLSGDLIRNLPEGQVPADEHTNELEMIRHEDGKQFVGNPDSPILVMGQLAHVYKKESASLAAHLSKGIGMDVAIYDSKFKDREIVSQLLQNPESIGKRKIVLFFFVDLKMVE